MSTGRNLAELRIARTKQLHKCRSVALHTCIDIFLRIHAPVLRSTSSYITAPEDGH